MTTSNKHSEPVDAPAGAQNPSAAERPGILEGRNERTAARERRVLVKWLRRTAKRARKPEPIPHRQTLLHYRAAAVRMELLEIAAMLERTRDPDPASIKALRELLANGCDSPLYNPDIHISELRATLHTVRKVLVAHS
ncbi:MAG: hypothetical protein JO304_06940 [Solirubrobacterales bacterium]|nr:hypothetical protein [Solirubrobacterales bacterium]MBV9310626.1 hypothetical protein [Solirubrobacterales bacterium]